MVPKTKRGSGSLIAQRPATQSERLPYRSPRLIEHGTLREVTRAKGGKLKEVNKTKTTGQD